MHRHEERSNTPAHAQRALSRHTTRSHTAPRARTRIHAQRAHTYTRSAHTHTRAPDFEGGDTGLARLDHKAQIPLRVEEAFDHVTRLHVVLVVGVFGRIPATNAVEPVRAKLHLHRKHSVGIYAPSHNVLPQHAHAPKANLRPADA